MFLDRPFLIPQQPRPNLHGDIGAIWKHAVALRQEHVQLRGPPQQYQPKGDNICIRAQLESFTLLLECFFFTASYARFRVQLRDAALGLPELHLEPEGPAVRILPVPALELLDAREVREVYLGVTPTVYKANNKNVIIVK